MAQSRLSFDANADTPSPKDRGIMTAKADAPKESLKMPEAELPAFFGVQQKKSSSPVVQRKAII